MSILEKKEYLNQDKSNQSWIFPWILVQTSIPFLPMDLNCIHEEMRNEWWRLIACVLNAFFWSVWFMYGEDDAWSGNQFNERHVPKFLWSMCFIIQKRKFLNILNLNWKRKWLQLINCLSRYCFYLNFWKSFEITSFLEIEINWNCVWIPLCNQLLIQFESMFHFDFQF